MPARRSKRSGERFVSIYVKPSSVPGHVTEPEEPFRKTLDPDACDAASSSGTVVRYPRVAFDVDELRRVEPRGHASRIGPVLIPGVQPKHFTDSRSW